MAKLQLYAESGETPAWVTWNLPKQAYRCHGASETFERVELRAGASIIFEAALWGNFFDISLTTTRLNTVMWNGVHIGHIAGDVGVVNGYMNFGMHCFEKNVKSKNVETCHMLWLAKPAAMIHVLELLVQDLSRPFGDCVVHWLRRLISRRYRKHSEALYRRPLVFFL